MPEPSPEPQPPVWNADKPHESLARLYAAAVGLGESMIGWYRRHSSKKKAGSLIIRTLAIFFTGVGTLLPLVEATGVFRRGEAVAGNVFGQWGYVAFATAAALVLADKFFGLSSGWMRFIKTQITLERALTEFRCDWVMLLSKLPAQSPPPDQILLLLQRVKDFSSLVYAQVQQETEAWILEFQSNLAELDKTARAQAEAPKPGSIEVVVANAADFDGGVLALLDGAEEKKIVGGKGLFAVVTPGPHEVRVRGTKAGKTFEANEVIKVAPDAVAPATLTIPTT